MAPVPCIGFLCAPAALLSLVVVPYLVPVFRGFVPVGVAAFLVDLLVGGARAPFFSRLNFYFLMVRPGNVLMCLPQREDILALLHFLRCPDYWISRCVRWR